MVKHYGRAGLPPAMVVEIQALRKSGMAQRAISKKLRVSLPTVNRYCQSVGIDVQTIEKMARLLRDDLVRCQRERENLMKWCEHLSKLLETARALKVPDISGALAEFEKEKKSFLDQFEIDFKPLKMKAAALSNAVESNLDALVEPARKKVIDEGTATLKKVSDERAGALAALDRARKDLPDALALKSLGDRAVSMVAAEIQTLKTSAITEMNTSASSTIKQLGTLNERAGLRVLEVSGSVQACKDIDARVAKASHDLDARLAEFDKYVLGVNAGLAAVIENLNGEEACALIDRVARRTTAIFSPRPRTSDKNPSIGGGALRTVDLRKL